MYTIKVKIALSSISIVYIWGEGVRRQVYEGALAAAGLTSLVNFRFRGEGSGKT